MAVRNPCCGRLSRSRIVARFIFACLCALPLSVSAAAYAAGTIPLGEEVRHRSHLEVFKDMALSRCIGQAYAVNAAIKADADSAASGYVEFNSFDFERGGKALSALITRYLARRYSSFQGPDVKLDLMKCIDLYHSRELDALGMQYVSSPRKSYAAGKSDP